jgi:hypothetical protein
MRRSPRAPLLLLAAPQTLPDSDRQQFTDQIPASAVYDVVPVWKFKFKAQGIRRANRSLETLPSITHRQRPSSNHPAIMSQHLEDIKDEKQQEADLEYVEYAAGQQAAGHEDAEIPFVVSPEDDKRVCRIIDRRLLPVSDHPLSHVNSHPSQLAHTLSRSVTPLSATDPCLGLLSPNPRQVPPGLNSRLGDPEGCAPSRYSVFIDFKHERHRAVGLLTVYVISTCEVAL